MSIEFENIPFEWENKGTEPPETLKNEGWKPSQKPAAAYFNAQWSRTSDSIKELQSKLSDYHTTNESDKQNLSQTKLDSATAIGRNLAGKTVSPSYDKETGTPVSVTAGSNSEIFNDYRNRTYSSSGGISTGNIASGRYSHAEGQCTTASGVCSHAEGATTKAEGINSHAEGEGTTASGQNSHAQGTYTKAGAYCASAGGYGTIASYYQLVCGRLNSENAGPAGLDHMTGSLFIVGNGTSAGARGNAFRVSTEGKAYGLSNFSGSGAGVAELYEWADGNPKNEDRRGLFVTLDGEKIRIATPDDDYILGTIDPCPYVVGDVQSEIWKDMYLKDVFGEKLIETVNVKETTDETGRVIPAHTEKRWVLNPEYDPKKKYVSRDERNEFVAITSKGKVVMIDDGSCQVNKYCTVGENGIATASDDNYAVRVMERIDDTHIRVYIDSVFINKNS